jgi:hypothetical protein
MIFSFFLGMHCTCHRVFLATLIVAAKYLNDQSPKNKHWSAHSSVFSVGEVNLMEKQLLSLLDFDLRITEADLGSSLQDFLQLQAATAAPSSTNPVFSETSSRYATPTSNKSSTSIPSPTSSYMPQGVPINQPSSNKRESFSRQGMAEIQLEQQPQQRYLHEQQYLHIHEQFKRRPSLPNQPSLEEGEVMPVYKGPIRNNQDQYPSPDGADDLPAGSADCNAAARKEAWMAANRYNSTAMNLTVPVLIRTQTGFVTNAPQDNGETNDMGHYGSSRAMC